GRDARTSGEAPRTGAVTPRGLRSRGRFSSRRLLAEAAPVLTRRVERVGHQLTAGKRLLHFSTLHLPLEEAPVSRQAPRPVLAQGGDLRASGCAVPHGR